MKENRWIKTFAETLVCEVTEWMSGIMLTHEQISKEELQSKELCVISGCANGDLQVQMQLKAEPQMLFHLAEVMSGEEPEDDELVQEYAVEYVNVICGRFVSALCDDLKVVLYISTPVYETAPEVVSLEEEQEATTLTFRSRKGEAVLFTWKINSINNPTKEGH